MNRHLFREKDLAALLQIRHVHFTIRNALDNRQIFSLLCAIAQTKKPGSLEGPGFRGVWRGGDLLSHANAHYHRRKPVSRSCSGWEGVVPGCYSRHMDGTRQ